MDHHQPRIAVIGAGIIGLSSALALVQSGYRDVTIISKRWSPNTVSNEAMAFVMPFKLGVRGGEADVLKWSIATRDHFLQARASYGGWQTERDSVSNVERNVYRRVATILVRVGTRRSSCN